MASTDLGQVVQRGLSKKKKYDAIEMKPLAGATDDDDDDTEKKSKADEWLEYAWRKLHALLWIIIAGALATWLELVDVVLEGHTKKRPERELHRCAMLPAASLGFTEQHLNTTTPPHTTCPTA